MSPVGWACAGEQASVRVRLRGVTRPARGGVKEELD